MTTFYFFILLLVTLSTTTEATLWVKTYPKYIFVCFNESFHYSKPFVRDGLVCKSKCAAQRQCVMAKYGLNYQAWPACFLLRKRYAGEIKCSGSDLKVYGGIIFTKELNECIEKKNACGKGANINCINTYGSYKRVCKKGYVMDGKECKKVQNFNWAEHRYGCFATKSYDSTSFAIEDNCKYLCGVRPDCLAARFNDETKMCYLASNRDIERLKTCSHYNVVFEKVPDTQWLEHRHGCFATESHNSTSFAVEDDCKYLCAVKPDCLTARFNIDVSMCYLASNRRIEKLKSCSRKNVVFEKVPQTQWIKFPAGCFETKYYQDISVNKEDHCQHVCAIQSDCEVARYHIDSRTCYLASNRQINESKDCKHKSIVFEKAITECNGLTKKCKPFAYCLTKDQHQICRCRIGYSGDGKTCQDVNECATYDNLCESNAECINTVGSYVCVCKLGYSLNGKICKKESPDVEEHYDDINFGGFYTIYKLLYKSSVTPTAKCNHVITIMAFLLVQLISCANHIL